MMLKQFLRALLMGAMLALICTALPAAQADPGDLDTTFAGFGRGGIVSEPAPATTGMALQPDGRIVTVRHNAAVSILVVTRYLPNGARDETFSGDGKAEIPFPEGIGLYARDVAVQSDGKIVVAGQTTSSASDDNSDFLLVRLTAAGDLDPSFGIGGGGIVTTNLTGNEDFAQAVLIQPDGKIVACGTSDVGDNDFDFAVMRYLPDGAPDPGFGRAGQITIGFGQNDYCYNLAYQSDRKLVLVGFKNYEFGGGDFALARLEPNGSLDDTSNGDGGFDGDGKVVTDFGGYNHVEDVVILPDGKIVALGISSIPDPDTSYIARYLSNGTLDGSFGSGGKKTIPGDLLYALALQPDGKLMTLGSHRSSGISDFAFHRLLANGDPDPTFDNEGIRWQDFGDANEAGTDLALLPDGRILGFGKSGSRQILVRLWPDGTFDSGGKQTHGVAPGVRETAYALAVQPDGKLLVAGEGHYPFPGYQNSNVFLSRFHTDGQVDTGFGTLGNAQIPFIVPPILTPPHRGAYALAVQPDGKIVAAGYNAPFGSSTSDFLVLRWNSNGTPDSTFDGDGWKLLNFPGNGGDYGQAVAVTPDGRIVVAGVTWDGSRQLWGVARLTGSGGLDSSFGPNRDGLATLSFNGETYAHAVLVQPDGKIVLAGHNKADFALARLLENGLPDPGFGLNGVTVTDLGGDDIIRALALDANGWLYAVGYRLQNGSADMALAQYRPDGRLAECPAGQVCNHWPEGKRFVNLGGFELAAAVSLRTDNRLIAAGCSNGQMAAAQVSTTDVNAPELVFRTDFVGPYDCALGAAFDAASRRLTLAGQQVNAEEGNIALARFDTTAANPGPTPTPPPGSLIYPLYLPLIVR